MWPWQSARTKDWSCSKSSWNWKSCCACQWSGKRMSRGRSSASGFVVSMSLLLSVLLILPLVLSSYKAGQCKRSSWNSSMTGSWSKGPGCQERGARSACAVCMAKGLMRKTPIIPFMRFGACVALRGTWVGGVWWWWVWCSMMKLSLGSSLTVAMERRRNSVVRRIRLYYIVGDPLGGIRGRARASSAQSPSSCDPHPLTSTPRNRNLRKSHTCPADPLRWLPSTWVPRESPLISIPRSAASHVSSKRWHFQKTQCRCRWLATGNAWPEPGTRLAGWYSLAYHLCVRRFYTSSNYFLIESICGDLCSTEYAEVCASMYRETVRFVQDNNVAHKCVLNWQLGSRIDVQVSDLPNLSDGDRVRLLDNLESWSFDSLSMTDDELLACVQFLFQVPFRIQGMRNVLDLDMSKSFLSLSNST